MQTLLAYAFDSEPAPGVVAAGLERVAAWYRPRWPAGARRRGATLPRLGVALWDVADNGCRWPGVVERPELTVATLHVPVAHEDVIGTVPPADAPVALVQALRRDHATVLELTPPFLLAAVEHPAAPAPPRLDLFLDPAGLARLFQLRTPEGWVWSNRPAAALRFAGTVGTPDVRGWRFEAATAFFMADSSPVDGMASVLGGTWISYDAGRGVRTQRRVDALSAWVTGGLGDPLRPERLDEVAAGLTAVARSVHRLWDEPPVLGLSGGRDSRMVVAAWYAAAADVTLTTTDTFPDETDTARALVAALPRPLPHQVVPVPRSVDAATPVVERALAWHRYGEGFRPPSFLPNEPPLVLPARNRPVVSGASGELCHGRYYPADIEEYAALPTGRRLDRMTTHLIRVMTPGGLSGIARELVRQRVRDDVATIRAAGVDDARVFDCFYVIETMRRWGTAGEPGTVSALLHPAFIRAALDLDVRQRLDNALPRALTARLVPQWADLPFVGAAGLTRAPRPRLWQEPGRDAVTTIIAEPRRWRDAFDVETVQRAWRNVLDGGTTPYEGLLQRALWRATYADFLTEVAGGTPPAQPPTDPAEFVPVAAAPSAAAPADAAASADAAGSPPVALATRLRRSAAARRVRRSPVGPALARLRRRLTRAPRT